MNYIGVELYKLNHSKSGRIFMCISILTAVFFIMMFMQRKEMIKGTLQLMPAVINNMDKSFVFIAVTAFVTSFIFAKEFQDRTYLYVFFRPVSLAKLYMNRIIAIMIYLFEIFFVISFICALAGIVLFKGFTIETGDTSLKYYIIRNILFISVLWFQNIFIILLDILISGIVENQMFSTVITIIAAIIISFIAGMLPSYMQSFMGLTYNLLKPFENQSLNEFAMSSLYISFLTLANGLVFGIPGCIYILKSKRGH